jgi:hypothetical protein
MIYFLSLNNLVFKRYNTITIPILHNNILNKKSILISNNSIKPKSLKLYV